MALRELFATFGIEFDTKELSEGNKAVKAALGTLGEFGGMIGPIIGDVLEFANAFSEQASALQDASSNLGVTTQELQSMQHAAGMAGVSHEKLNSALGIFTGKLQEAKGGSGKAADAMRALGVSVTDAHGQIRPVPDLMNDISEGMDRIEQPAQRARIAAELFGGAGRRLLGTLHGGAEGFAEMRADLEDLGGGMSTEAVDAADAYGDELDRLHTATDSVRSVLATALLPVLTQGVRWVTEITATFAKWVKGTHLVQIALGALGIAVAAAAAPAVAAAATVIAAWLPAAAPAIAMVAAVVALGLALDDFITTMEGGDSVLGRFLDRSYGLGTSQHTVHALGEAWDGVKLATHDAGVALGNAWESTEQKGSEFLTWLGAIGDQITKPFSDAWTAIDTATSGALTSMKTKVMQWLEPLGRMLDGISQSITNMFSGGSGPGFFQGIIDDWRNLVFDVGAPPPPGAAAAAGHGRASQRATAPAGHGPASITTHRSVGPTTIHVSGVGSPEQVARRVMQLQAERERTAHDEDHPLPHPED